jgi:hypothetical protein
MVVSCHVILNRQHSYCPDCIIIFGWIIVDAQYLVTMSFWTSPAWVHTLPFQPMLELMEYLRANGFKTYIVSGSDFEFLRWFAEDVYGVPPDSARTFSR